MPKVMNVEKKIRDIEEFDVTIRDSNGKDIRGDKRDLPQYPFERKITDGSTVSQWINARFLVNYPGLRVDVLDGDGSPVIGQTKIGTVRDTYKDN